MNYQNIMILGTSQLAAFCARIITGKGYGVCVIDTGPVPNTILSAACKSAGVSCFHFSKAERKNAILGAKGDTLLISVVNPWVIPQEVLNKKGMKAVNLHHSLLPRHPGRNAEAWAIYEGDQQAGITWHFVIPKVDAGDIIIQAGVKLNDTVTSLKLLQIQDRLAKETFEKICPDLLEGKVTGTPQDREKRPVLHYSWQVPNDGYLDISWGAVKISRFLRAMDYGAVKTLGRPKIVIGKYEYTWDSYKIMYAKEGAGVQEIETVNSNIMIYKKEAVFKLKNAQRMDLI